jgi:hypothetical protein
MVLTQKDLVKPQRIEGTPITLRLLEAKDDFSPMRQKYRLLRP